MAHDRYQIQWIGYCEFENKIWGYFFYQDPFGSTQPKWAPKPVYAFWAKLHKTPDFKRHNFSKWQMEKLVNKKIANRYAAISVEDMEKMWPEIYNELDTKFVYHILAENL